MTTAWVLTEGMAGTQNQCVALAHAAGFAPEIKTIRLRQPWKMMTPWLRGFSPTALVTGSSVLAPPWPDVIIASGRKAIAPALWIKKQSKGATKLVIVQSPVIKSDAFDLVIVPRHDRYRAPNAFEITGALSVVDKDVLGAAKEKWSAALASLPNPRVAVLIGGDSRTHKMTPRVTRHWLAQLQGLLRKGLGLMLTLSRRTPPAAREILQQGLMQEQNVLFWDGSGDNPYHGFLAWADVILVSEDSVSMACEAISTGKPVYLLPMAGGSKRFARFHDYIVEQGFARWFDGDVAPFSYTPPDDLQRAAKVVQELL